MSIQQEILLRYKSTGHVRFQIPSRLCSDAVASAITKAIENIDGVYRVNLFRHKKKLSIRFIEENLPYIELIRQLIDIITDIENKGFFKEKPVAVKTSSLKKSLKLPDWKGVNWAKEKYTETRETAQAIGILTKLGLKKKPEIIASTEKNLVTFFNDVLVLFLIKVHWKLITKKWIVEPMKYRYQWITVFYLMYLFIRSKTNKNK